MAITAEQFSQLVVDVYEAALTPSSWPTALDNITHAVDAAGAGLVVAAADSRTPQCATLPVEAIDAYRAHYREVDYVLADVEAGPVGVVRTGPEVIDPVGHAEFDADWMRPNNVQDGLFVRLTDTDWPTSFLLAAPRRSQPFATPERIQVVTALVPHLQQALRAQDQIAGSAQWAHDLGDVIDTSTDGMVLVDARGKVLYVNNTAHGILTAGDGITVRNNHLHACHAATDQALAGAITSAATHDDAVPRGDALPCPRPSGARAYILHILPLHAEQDGAAPGRVVIALIDPARETKPDKALLQRLFGLTSAEANVALEMLAGQGLPAVAEKMFLSVTTVRSHLQRVYDKTDTHRQAELVRLLVSLRFA